MSMGKSDLHRAIDSLTEAQRHLRSSPEFIDTLEPLIKAVAHLADYCHARVADHPALYPYQLNAAIENLTGRIEALENPVNPLYAARPVERDEWQHLLDAIGGDCRKHGWTDIDALIAWQMGRAAMMQARLHRARFDHDPNEENSA